MQLGDVFISDSAAHILDEHDRVPQPLIEEHARRLPDDDRPRVMTRWEGLNLIAITERDGTTQLVTIPEFAFDLDSAFELQR
ncbi:MAG: hypothetical protein ACFB50_09730 [Rubrobacteraceae bacterium]